MPRCRPRTHRYRRVFRPLPLLCPPPLHHARRMPHAEPSTPTARNTHAVAIAPLRTSCASIVYVVKKLSLEHQRLSIAELDLHGLSPLLVNVVRLFVGVFCFLLFAQLFEGDCQVAPRVCLPHAQFRRLPQRVCSRFELVRLDERIAVIDQSITVAAA